jgi:hypothetical protein
MTLFLLGENISVGDGHARAFRHDDIGRFELRSNVTYDEAVALLKVGRK